MRAGLATTQEEIAIPPQHISVFCTVEIWVSLIAEHRYARLAAQGGALSTRLGDLICRSVGAQHRIVEIEGHTKIDTELAQPFRPSFQIRGVPNVPRIERSEIGGRTGAIELIAEQSLRRQSVQQELIADRLDTTSTATGTSPIQIEQRDVRYVEIAE